MGKILSLLRDFFLALFAGGKKEATKRRELKKLNRELRGSRHRYYKPYTNEVLPSFAQAVFRFAQYARLLRDFFEKTILSENAKHAELYKDFLIEERLDETNRFKKSEFSYQAMKDRLASRTSFTDAFKEISREFTAYLELFRQPQFQNFNREYTELDRLAAVSRYDFEKLLSFFDPHIRVTAAAHMPNFAPAPGWYLTQDLMDFYFVMSGLRFDQNLTQNVILLYTRIRGSADESEIEKVKKILSSLEGIQKNYLPPEILLSLLKSVNEDPSFAIPHDHEIQEYLELYKNRLLSRFELDREKLVREHTENAVEHSLAELFGKSELMKSAGLPEDLGEELVREGFVGLTRSKPFHILKTFVAAIFEKSIKEHIKQLVINAFFENKTFKEKFISLFHEIQGAYDAISSLEQTLCEQGEVGIPAVRGYLEKHHSGKTVSASLSKLVETINDNMGRLLEEITNAFSSFNRALHELIEDAKQHSPLIVGNIKVIGGERNREFIGNLVDDNEKISLFIDIMKNFTILRAGKA